jgi:hypothetical protein
MYFLINDVDNSVNCASQYPFSVNQLNEVGVSFHELPIDHLPVELHSQLHNCHYDPDTNSIIPNKLGLVQLTDAEARDWFAQQAEIAKAVSLSNEEKLLKLVQRMAELHPEDAVFAEIASDGVVTSDELKRIEDMLNGVNP